MGIAKNNSRIETRLARRGQAMHKIQIDKGLA